jgi:hypothetical protein
VKLDYLEAQLHPVEQLDKRPPWTAEGRTMQEQLSRRRAWVHIIMEVSVPNTNYVATQMTSLSFAPKISLFVLKL